MSGSQQSLLGKKILVIDDDINLCRSIKLLLERSGAEVITALDGRDGLRQFFEQRPELVILDIMMPDMNGWETCRQIRLLSDTPIIMLTTIDRDESIIRGLNHGADDFISKPFSTGVLIARVQAVLRRGGHKMIRESGNDKGYMNGDLFINLNTREIRRNDEVIRLTATEFRVLSYLVQNTGQIMTYNQILEHVWGWEYRDSVDYVHVYLSHLRRKLEEDPRNPKYLLTEHGIGYMLAKNN